MSPDSRWTRRLSSAQVPGGIYTIFIPRIWCQFLFKMTTKSLCMTLMGPGRRVDVSEHTYELRQSVGATTVVTTSLHGTYSISWYLVSIFIQTTTLRGYGMMPALACRLYQIRTQPRVLQLSLRSQRLPHPLP